MNHTTHLDGLIAAERKKANARIAKLKREAAAQQRKVDTRLVQLLKEQKPDLHTSLEDEARHALDAEKARRSTTTKRTTQELAAVPASGSIHASEHSEEVRHPWNG